MTSKWRVAAGVVILALLAGSVVVLAPTYYRHFRLEQSLEGLVSGEGAVDRSDEELRRQAVAGAVAVGIPLREDQIRVSRSGGALRIEARYIVRVDVPAYTVDLHFRAGSGAR